MEFLFYLGFSEDIARLELETVLGKKVTKVSPRCYLVKLDSFSRLQYVAGRLGGLVEVRSKSKQKLVWRHQARSWYKRDRLKPFADGKKGMIPPKIARMMVNLALGKNYNKGQALLDPFCGSGNILIEAGLLKLRLIGSDVNLEQIKGTKENLNWLGISNFNLLKLDATHVSSQFRLGIDYIVTEPFMGKPNLRPDRVKYVVRGLRKLYLGSLKDWLKALVPGGRVCMVMPIMHDEKKSYTLSKVIDDKSLVGYNIQTRGLVYSKPKSNLKREIIVLKKK